MHRMGLVFAVTVAALTSCGGGANDDDRAASRRSATAPSPAAPSDPAPSVTSSAACFNAGLLRAGTTTDLEITVSGTNGSTPPRRIVSEVTGPKEFNGAAAIETEIEFYGDAGQPVGRNHTYNAVQGDFFVNYGEIGDAVLTLDPPKRRPLGLEPGQTSAIKFRTKKKYADHSEAGVTDWSYTYVGRETLKSAVGTYQACKSKSHEVTVPEGGPSQVFDKVEWTFAEGPYRGLSARAHVTAQYPGTGLTIIQQIEVTKVSKFDIK